MPDATYYTIVEAVTKLKNTISAGRGIDQKEADLAIQKAKEADDCSYEDDFRKEIKTITDRLDGALTTLDNHMRDDFLPKLHIVSDLKKRENDWNQVSKDIGTVNTNVEQHLKLDHWDSQGAQAYKNALPTQQNALSELSGLATSSAKASNQMATLNQAVFDATQTSIQTVESYLKNKVPNWSTEATWTDGWEVGGYLNGKWIYDYEYFKRTANAAAQVQALNGWIDKVKDPYNADWSTAALGIGSDLDTDLNRPNNLKAYGVWPEAKAQDAAAVANTGDMGSHKADVNGTGTVDNNDSANFNRRGRG